MDILYQDNSILVCIKPAGVLSTDTMAELNYLVDEEGQKAEEVAHNFLVENLPEYARK